MDGGCLFQVDPHNPYTTSRKVFAEGMRVVESGLPFSDSALLKSGKAKIRQSYSRRNRRRMFRRLRFVSVPGYAPICVDTNDPQTVQHAFQQRLMRDLPVPKPGKIKAFSAFVMDFLKENVKKTNVLSFEEWLIGTPYTMERKEELRKVYELLRGGPPTSREASHVDTFVKSESYPVPKPGRMINSRSDKFKVWSGPLFKPIEDEVYSLPEFMKHTPVPERPNKILEMKQAGMKFYQTDFTAFESHFTPEILRSCECQLYAWCLSQIVAAPVITRTLTGSNRMRTRTGITASCFGRRMSGDMCTSLGNGFTNLMLAKFIAHEKGGELKGFVEGDDGLFSTNVELTAQDYMDLGFTIKIVEVLDPCQASFCGMIFSENGEIIRDPRRFMANFGWTLSFVNAGDKIMDELLRAKALSCAYETPQCPIVGAFARYALERTRGVVPRFVHDGYHQCPKDEKLVSSFSPSMSTRILFEKEYDISIAVQLRAEKAILRGDMEMVSSLIPPSVEMLDYASKYLAVT